MGASPQNVKKGFRSTGIWPFNPDIFNRDYFLPASVTDRPPPDESLHGPSTTTSSHLLMGSPLLPSYLLLGRRPPPSHLLLSCPLLLCMSHLVPWLFLTINSDSLEEVTLIFVPVPLSLQEEDVFTSKVREIDFTSSNVCPSNSENQILILVCVCLCSPGEPGVFCPELIRPYPKDPWSASEENNQ